MLSCEEQKAKLLDHLTELPAQEQVSFLVEKHIELSEQVKNNQKTIEELKDAINKSTLFFNIPEVNLISSSQLPRIVIGAQDPVGLDANLHSVESNGVDTYRWLGPNRLTTFSLPVNRDEEKTFIVRLCAQITEGLYGSIKVYVDGDLVEHDIELKDDKAELFVTLPATSRKQDTTVALFVPKLFKPSDFIEGSDDHRLLSVAFTQIEVV